ncbi:dipeptidase [Arcanobacterium haemolyticum]|nr:dipeptidase [Arcanobacterium haemolyticum]
MMTFEDLAGRVDAQFDHTRAELESLVRIPSISATAFDQVQVRRSAEAVAELARQRGLEAEVIELETADGRRGRPAVLAHKAAAPGKPTVLLYGHHDVQPDGDAEGWLTAPFEPVERDGRLYGRGTADDKAGVMLHLAALSALGDDLAAGVTLFIEGEEEVGSPTFHDFLNTYRDRLAADVIVVADSNNWQVGTPSLTTSLRGVVSVSVRLDVLDHALHSGAYGGPILDAVTLMSRLISTLHDDDGAVAVDGLISYDEAEANYTEEALRADAGVVDGVKLAGRGSIASRLWTQPCISVIGMDVTDLDHASNTLIPSCTARLSMRIAPGQNPAEAAQALTKHLETHAPFGARVEVTLEEAGPSFKAGGDTPASTAARWALESAWGTSSVDIGVGGSIPFISDLADVFPQAQILVTGVEDPDTRAHSQNESLHLGDWRNAILAEAALLARLGETL